MVVKHFRAWYNNLNLVVLLAHLSHDFLVHTYGNANKSRILIETIESDIYFWIKIWNLLYFMLNSL